VLSIAPQATERILWHGLSYHKTYEGGPVKGAICQIVIRNNKVRLDFIHGICLPDPDGLLQGDRKSKRYVYVAALDDVFKRKLSRLIQAAVEFNATEAYR
jgi:hypothetical protein